MKPYGWLQSISTLPNLAASGDDVAFRPMTSPYMADRAESFWDGAANDARGASLFRDVPS